MVRSHLASTNEGISFGLKSLLTGLSFLMKRGKEKEEDDIIKKYQLTLGFHYDLNDGDVNLI